MRYIIPGDLVSATYSLEQPYELHSSEYLVEQSPVITGHMDGLGLVVAKLTVNNRTTRERFTHAFVIAVQGVGLEGIQGLPRGIGSLVLSCSPRGP